MLHKYSPDSAHVKPLGRTRFQDGLLWCAHSGTGAEFRLTGRQAVLTLIGDSVCENDREPASREPEPSNDCRITVEVSGVRVFCGCLTQKITRLTILDSPTIQKVTIRVVKLSEAAMSTFAIQEILTDAPEVVPAPEKNFRIEFIGDSITCGYGVDAADETCHFTTATEDVTKSYAYLTAQALSADYSMVSFSGYGIVSGFTADGQKNEKETLPQHYKNLGFSYALLNGHTPSEYPWDFSAFCPQLIVINLGTNDASYCRTDPEKQNLFLKGYLAFLKVVREQNPEAAILCTLGILEPNLYSCVAQAVTAFQEETGENNIFLMKFEPQSADDGYGADWHPSAATHRKAARKLTARIRELAACLDLSSPPLAALTFDDGPNTVTTPAVLDLLEQFEVPASFFVVGKNITPASEEVVRRAVRMGCEIGNHSLTHSAMNQMEAEELRRELAETSDKIETITGSRPRFFRPPYIAVSSTMHEEIDLPFICGLGAEDWEEEVSASERAERILSEVTDGAILLLHDMEGNEKTVQALERIIPELKNRGYELVTVEELFRRKQVKPEQFRGTVISVVDGRNTRN